jgi:hypothetical protein
MRGAEPVRRAWNYLQGSILDQFHAQAPRVVDWRDLVCVALNHERRNIDLFEIFGLVRLRESLNAVVCAND